MAIAFDELQIKEIEKKMKKLPSLPKKMNKQEALEFMSGSIIKLFERGYTAKQITEELAGFGFKTSINHIKKIITPKQENTVLKQQEMENKNEK